MAMEPVAVAASNNPLLTTLVAAVSGEVNPDVVLIGESDRAGVWYAVSAFSAIRRGSRKPGK
mgnify:CR=1 FL=1